MGNDDNNNWSNKDTFDTLRIIDAKLTRMEVDGRSIRHDLKEHWRLHPEGKHEVSNTGKIKKLAHSVAKIHGKYNTSYTIHKGPKELALIDNGKGYLADHCNGTMKYIHRAVYETFIGPIADGLEINHKDGNRQNNNIENLELLSHRDNLLYRNKLGTAPIGEANHMSKLTEAEVIKIKEKLAAGVGVTSLASIYNVSHTTICRIKTGKSWGHIIL